MVLLIHVWVPELGLVCVCEMCLRSNGFKFYVLDEMKLYINIAAVMRRSDVVVRVCDQLQASMCVD